MATATRRKRAWLGRGLVAGLLLAGIFLPARASDMRAPGCRTWHCGAAGKVRWVRRLPGSWTIQGAIMGTVPAPSGGQAQAAAGNGVAVLGFGLTVYGYHARDGDPLWTARLTGFPAGSVIVSLRVWPGVVTAGVARGPLITDPPQAAVLLSAASGQRLRTFPAAPSGGAVSAGQHSTIVVGPGAVTSYVNATGRIAWSRSIGPARQDWRTDGGYLYVAEQAGGDLGAGPVTALRRISLSRTGAEQVVRPHGQPFDGKLSAAARGVALFSSARGVTAYSATTGQLLWRLAGAVPESVDLVRGLFYLTTGSMLTGVQPATGRIMTRVSGAYGSGASGVLGVRDGVALGLDQGPPGQLWGYDVAGQQVVWTSRRLPWPHYFVDLSGLGGSADPASNTVLVTACAQPAGVAAGQACQAPELVAINR